MADSPILWGSGGGGGGGGGGGAEGGYSARDNTLENGRASPYVHLRQHKPL